VICSQSLSGFALSIYWWFLSNLLVVCSQSAWWCALSDFALQSLGGFSNLLVVLQSLGGFALNLLVVLLSVSWFNRNLLVGHTPISWWLSQSLGFSIYKWFCSQSLGGFILPMLGGFALRACLVVLYNLVVSRCSRVVFSQSLGGVYSLLEVILLSISW
jgi:hypothetical protein